MSHVEPRWRPHWLDGARCKPGTHDHHTPAETSSDLDTQHARTERLIAAFFMCAGCPVDHARCLQNGVQLEADGVYGGVLLENGKPVNPPRRRKKTVDDEIHEAICRHPAGKKIGRPA